MREIKFRAWDEDKNQMIEWSDDFFYDTSAVTCYSGLFSEISEMILMQYTGLLDKNGVEIYEGDIVELDNNKYEINFGEALMWENRVDCNGWYMECSDKKNWVIHNFIYERAIECEVIGNIYSNPKLLDNQKPMK